MQREKETVLSTQESPQFWCRQAAPNCGPKLERNLETGTHSLLKCASRFNFFFCDGECCLPIDERTGRSENARKYNQLNRHAQPTHKATAAMERMTADAR
jgi:hypothetical protein